VELMVGSVSHVGGRIEGGKSVPMSAVPLDRIVRPAGLRPHL